MKATFFGHSAKQIATDYLLTFAGSIATVGIIQIVVYPTLARVLSNEEYGVFLTAIGVINSIMPTFGSTLRNARILFNDRFEKAGLGWGDFNHLLLVTAPTVSIAASIMLSLTFSLKTIDFVLVVLLLLSGIAKDYCLFAFRVPINSIGNFVANLAAGIGYVTGIPVAVAFKSWVIPFLMAELFSLLYTLCRTRCLRGELKRTVLFGRVAKEYFLLVLTNLVSYCSTYVDRFFLYPILGASAVSTYYAASFAGKACSFFTSPVSTLLLSYISVNAGKMSRKQFNAINASLLLGAGAAAAAVGVFGPWITAVLYPELAGAAAPYILLGNSASILSVVNGINVIVVLKLGSARWQLYISLMKLLLYGVAVAGVWISNSLMVFCWLLLLSNISIFIFTYVLGSLFISRQGSDDRGNQRDKRSRD